jgi:mono/diheme cytochrome c family protein
MRSSPLPAAGMLVLLASLCVAPFTASAQGVQAVSAGAALFGSRCAACHSLDANRVGPMLRGVGRGRLSPLLLEVKGADANLVAYPTNCLA